MKKQPTIDFWRIVEAIKYLQENFRKQPRLEEIAKKLHMSPFHFQRLFTRWAGVSPKKFLQYISIEHAKVLLKENQSSLFQVAHKTGLSGTGRLHDLFVNIEGMTPGEYKNGGENLSINYSFVESLFGSIIVASTKKGICYLAYIEDQKVARKTLQSHFPNATYQEMKDHFQRDALCILKKDFATLPQVQLHLRGTPFQIKVWEALLRVPLGQVSTYGRVAAYINKPKASRAVGTAIGKNPVAFLIPCHRIIQSSGIVGSYHWGNMRKKAMIGWENSKARSTRIL